MPGKVRIAVVDDHPLFRGGVTQLLDSQRGFEVVAEGASGEDAVRISDHDRPDLILLDISMPGNGIDAARTIAKHQPKQKIIMLTVSESEDHVTSALESGAHGYVLKGTGADELIASIKAVLKGRKHVAPDLAATLLSTRRAKASTRPTAGRGQKLTPRESEILDHVSRGMTNMEIANTLGLSEKTVKHHMTRIMQKLQVKNRVEAATKARRR